MNGPDRQTVLEKALQGDREALGALLDSFRPYLRVIVYDLRRHRLAARADDSDFIQDAIHEALASFSQFRGHSVEEFTAWLRIIAIRSVGRLLRDGLRTGKRDPEREQVVEHLDRLLADSSSSPSGKAVRHEEELRMADALARLPDDMRLVLLSRHVEDLSHAEIAASMNRSVEAVRQLYVRALKRLRKELGATPPRGAEE